MMKCTRLIHLTSNLTTTNVKFLAVWSFGKDTVCLHHAIKKRHQVCKIVSEQTTKFLEQYPLEPGVESFGHHAQLHVRQNPTQHITPNLIATIKHGDAGVIIWACFELYTRKSAVFLSMLCANHVSVWVVG